MSALGHAVALIRKWEGCRLEAYLCPAGVWTIGWGSTGAGIRQGLRWKQTQADERLATDVESFMKGVRRLLKRAAHDNEIGAMTSLAYNVGLRAFEHSTLLRLFNAGDTAGAAREFAKWNRGGGRVLAGLVKRRADEAEVFSQPPDTDDMEP